MQDDVKLEAFAQSKAAYYRDKWRRFETKAGFAASFNIAAALGQVAWLAYRKLYLPLVLLFIVYIADVSLTLYAEENGLVSDKLISVWNWVTGILYLGVLGIFGNYWYWKKYQKIDVQAISRAPDRDSQLAYIRSRGGTNPVGAWLVVIVLLIPVTWVFYWGVYQASKYDISSFVFDATGPLTLDEIEANFLVFMDEPLEGDRKACVYQEIEERARAAGDPETLDPATVDYLPANTWPRLDAEDRRLILTQAIVTKATIVCNRPAERRAVQPPTTPTGTAASKEVIVAGDPRFDVFELQNSAGDHTFASPDATVLLSFRAKDSRYCRAARFSADYTVVLACRGESGWEVEAISRFSPGESTVATNFGGGGGTEVFEAVRELNPSRHLLNEAEIVEAASNGWR